MPFQAAAYGNELFQDLEARGERFEALRFDECVFDRCDFKETRWRDCRFRGCQFRHCDLGLADLAGSALAEVVFEECHLVGVVWTQLALPVGRALRADFFRCTLDDASFDDCDLDNRRLYRCALREASFRNTRLRGADLRGAELAGAIFHNTDLREADLREARDYAIDPTRNRVARARFQLPEALGLLSGLDVEVS